MDLITYQDKISGTLSCLDRVIITVTIPQYLLFTRDDLESGCQNLIQEKYSGCLKG